MPMNTFLWILQGLMAFVTLPAGLHAALRPVQRVEVHGTLVRADDWPSPAQRLGGVLSAACGTALVLPGLVHLATVLTPIAALALLGPAVFLPARKLRNGEIGPAFWFFGTLYLTAPSVLVAWGRLGPYPL